jgi:hypothetical protein
MSLKVGSPKKPCEIHLEEVKYFAPPPLPGLMDSLLTGVPTYGSDC